MRIRMRTLSCTPERTLQPGQVVEVPNEEAARLLEGGFAEPVTAKMKRESPFRREAAVAAVPEEAAVEPAAPARRRRGGPRQE